MIEWSKYALRDAPVADFPHVDVHSPDIRINGRKFYVPPVKETLEKTSALLDMNRTRIFLLSPEMVLGTGKSALLAHLYWRLFDAGERCVWVQVTGYAPMRRILLKVADEMSSVGIIAQLQRRLTSQGSIRKGLERLSSRIPSHPSLAAWTEKALSKPDMEFASALSNVGRQTQAFGVPEAFSYILDILKVVTQKPIYVFLDQLEIYVMTTRATQVAVEFNEFVRGISNKAFLLATLHTDARTILETKCGEHVETFLKNSPMIDLNRMSADDCVEIGAYWLEQFRLRKVDKLYPFTRGAMLLIAKRTELNVRDFLSAMMNALSYAASSGYPDTIDEKFLSTKSAKAYVFITQTIQR